ncbi:biopolymer transporter ExbD [Pelistega indica]|uniref:Biopolymer transporter ExbD n=1 Tax=Pelistega indica TaxID=1414851 RepID=V8G8F9_9BURK|nr:MULTISPECIES: ExbD/TolR family protein [Pelistega]ETD72396.1 biopolymer transporter ExbD [Pelistega indica]
MAANRKGRGRSRRLKNEMNVVPYIDVMLVLLVIFMVTAPMITPGLVNLPSVGRAAEVPTTPVEVQLEENGDVSVRLRQSGAEFEKVPKEEVLSRIQSMAQADTPVVISADGKVAYEEVMKIMDTLRSNGLTRLGLMVNQTKQANTKK